MRLLSENGVILSKDLVLKTGLTAGNLHSHCKTLEKSGLITRKKVLTNDKFHLTYQITPQGLSEFRSYVSKLSKFLDKTKFALRGSIDQIKYHLPPSIFSETEDNEGNQLNIASFD